MQQAWAKLERTADGTVTAALPLIDHCLDVGVALKAVLPAWARPLQVAAGRATTGPDEARLCALAALHDLGKANRGFQARIDPRSPMVGHTGPVATLLKQSGLRKGAAAQALAALIDAWGAAEHLAAVMAHHGKPLPEFHATSVIKTGVWTRHTDHWLPKADGDPTATVLALLDAVRARWPLAWEDGPPLPDAPRFVALFAGLVTLADWLGSDTRRFAIAGPHGAERATYRQRAAQDAAAARGFLALDTPPGDFTAVLGFPPHGFQSDAAAEDLGPVALIEAETGSGKTEAALWRWLELRRRGMVDGLFFALPTRSAAVQLHARVDAMLRRVWGDGGPRAVLAVPGYLRFGDAHGQALPGYAVRWDGGEPGGAEDRHWAAERANRFLAARVAVGTIDQALLGTLPVKHALFRAGVLSRSLLVVDEVHASDAYMTGLLDRLLANHTAIGGHALLLSATLGAAARARLLKTPRPTLDAALSTPYPALSGYAAAPRRAEGGARGDKAVRVEIAGLIADPQAIADRAVAAARAGAAVLVVRNTVSDAIPVAQAVAAMAPDLAFGIDDVATLHHSRFARADRERLDARVEALFGKHRSAGGRVLVGTQTLEQSLDIDADLLITDLAPIDVLLQRIGRLHRHARTDRAAAFADARVVLLRPTERDLSSLLGTSSRHGLGSVYPDPIQLEATLRVLESGPEIRIPRDNRRLVEGALHPDVLDGIARDLGADWVNHANRHAGAVFADGRSAAQVALDLSHRFTDLLYPDDLSAVTTRLGARDLLVDVDSALAGPFGQAVRRFAIPGWMIREVDATAPVERVDDRHFRIGARRFRYDQWGLHVAGD